MLKRNRGWGAVALFLLTASHLFGATVVIEPVKDNTLYENPTGTVSNGAGVYLFAGRTAQSPNVSRRRALLAFDVADHIPPGSTITSVNLTLYMSRTATSSTIINLHRALTNWGEGASDASGEEGAGAAAENGDATWLHTFYDTNIWSSPGGDYFPALSAYTSVVGLGSYTWSSTPELVADVQSWFDDPESDFGWVLIGNEDFSTTAKRFDSRESVTQENRPFLTIEFTQPVPAVSTWGLAITALLFMIAGTIVCKAYGSTAVL